ncbi:MAG: hypothetical protein DLM57_15600 [Pseudonocardiales bacterium]|nr:MAG: hypothetical protein DLM57_15600 [Pseudonocardiales bacterium]
MRRSRVAAFGLAATLALSAAACGHAAKHHQGAQALLVCNASTSPCPKETKFATIQSAVNAAHPGDWVLVWPGIYHEKADGSAGVRISTPNIHLRGLDRNLVVVDGSKGGTATPCPAAAGAQDTTPRDGILVANAGGVSIDNLTVCNYLSDAHLKHGNEVWWNGGDGTGHIGMTGYAGSYLSTTSTYVGTPGVTGAGQYGVFVSNAVGPGRISYSYAANMADSGFYLGACRNVCGAVLDHVHGTNSALGFSGTNAGGYAIRNSEFDRNRAGVVPNSLNNDDAPPPQNGSCPNDPAKSCTFIEDNFVHDNNNPNAPASDLAAAIGAGIELSGGQFDTVRNNHISNQGSWGVVIHDYPDDSKPPAVAHCEGGIKVPGLCLFAAKGNLVTGNTFTATGFFGNPTNGDLASQAGATPHNCFSANHDTGAKLTSDPATIALMNATPCAGDGIGDSRALVGQLECAADPASCAVAGSHYPKHTRTVAVPLTHQQTMPEPCQGTPASAFCGSQRYSGPHS